MSNYAHVAKKQKRESETVNLYENHEDTTHMSDEEMNDLYNFEKAKECKCCARHLSKRPSSLYCGWKTTNDPVYSWDGVWCGCYCRQTMRALARKYDDDEDTRNTGNILCNYIIE